MTLRMTAGRALDFMLGLLWLPGRVVEEMIHATAAYPFATAIVVHFDAEGGEAETLVDFRDGTPEWAIRAAHLAPEAVASAAGIAVIAWWVAHGPLWLPDSTQDWLLLSILGAQYLAIAFPSAADVDHSPEGESDG